MQNSEKMPHSLANRNSVQSGVARGSYSVETSSGKFSGGYKKTFDGNKVRTSIWSNGPDGKNFSSQVKQVKHK